MPRVKSIESGSSLKCVHCGEVKRASDEFKSDKNDFYKSRSTMFSGVGDYIPVCKDCFNEIYNEYLSKYKDEYDGDLKNIRDYYFERKAIERICMMFNIYYSDSVVDFALKKYNTNNVLSGFMKASNLIQFSKSTYDQTLLDNETKVAEYDVKGMKGVNKKTIKFFGEGLKDDSDYEFLQEQYNDWTSRHECKTKVQEELFKQICFVQLQLLKANRNKQDTKDLTVTFQKLLDSANLQPKQNSHDTMSDTQTFGTLIDKWENTRPVPDIDNELKDVDKIGLYVDVFFRGHLSKMMGLKNGLSNLYEKYIKKYTVEKPEYEDDNSEVLFDAIFGNQDISE